MPEPSGPLIDYPALLHAAVLGVVREVLARASRDGIPGDHHFYLTFRSDAEGVELSPALRRRFPKEMTVVLQHQFWNLEVTEASFAVTLRFGGVPERVHVPFAALTAFVDPQASFGLRLGPAEQGPGDRTDREAAAPPGEARQEAPREPPAAAPETPEGGRVVAFRRPEPKKD